MDETTHREPSELELREPVLDPAHSHVNHFHIHIAEFSQVWVLQLWPIEAHFSIRSGSEMRT